MVKARVVDAILLDRGNIFQVVVEFPEFQGQRESFTISKQEYQEWNAPEGIDKTPKNFLLHKYVEPAHRLRKESWENLSNIISKLLNLEFDW